MKIQRELRGLKSYVLSSKSGRHGPTTWRKRSDTFLVIEDKQSGLKCLWLLLSEKDSSLDPKCEKKLD